MKISKVDDASLQMIQQYQKADKVEDRASEKAAAANLVPEEKVNLSTTAKDVQILKNAISQLPDIREEKVQTLLKDHIEKGTYKVDAEKTAEKMVGESLLDIIT
jgi:flagellar biosynthesis anti-sigma factor FlgM